MWSGRRRQGKTFYSPIVSRPRQSKPQYTGFPLIPQPPRLKIRRRKLFTAKKLQHEFFEVPFKNSVAAKMPVF
jgi:hypothetical protein